MRETDGAWTHDNSHHHSSSAAIQQRLAPTRRRLRTLAFLPDDHAPKSFQRSLK
jgi:hypothetical protein